MFVCFSLTNNLFKMIFSFHTVVVLQQPKTQATGGFIFHVLHKLKCHIRPDEQKNIVCLSYIQHKMDYKRHLNGKNSLEFVIFQKRKKKTTKRKKKYTKTVYKWCFLVVKMHKQ